MASEHSLRRLQAAEYSFPTLAHLKHSRPVLDVVVVDRFVARAQDTGNVSQVFLRATLGEVPQLAKNQLVPPVILRAISA